MSPARARIGVSADAFVAVVRAYADRVHDDVRRLGCTDAEAAEVVGASALGLAERLRTRPHEVTDLVGAWFRDARVLAERVGSGVEPEDLVSGEGIVRRSEDDAAARQALAQLSDRDRVALLLRDAYDLPYLSTGVALGLDPDNAACVVARARLRFVALAGGAAAAEPEEHNAELANAARLADGQLPLEQVGATERHVSRCPACASVVPAMREARRLLSGLAILALPDADRDALIARATAVAERVLPSADEIAAAAARAEAPSRVLPPLGLTAACLAGAMVLGGVVALSSGDTSLSGRAGGAPTFEPGSSPTPTRTRRATPTPTPTRTTTPTPTPTPTVTVTRTVAPTRTASPTPTPTFEWSMVSQRISVQPDRGPNGQQVRVRGTGWRPGSRVEINYLNALGAPTGQQAVGNADRNGDFSANLVCLDESNIPGRHTIRAANASGQVAEATYDAEP